MKYLNGYKLFESNSHIIEICEKYDITNYTINEDGSIDVDGDVILLNNNLTEIPLNFRYVSGAFDCDDNKLNSLKGSPRTAGYFYCSNNGLYSLDGAPEKVANNFYCNSNNLTSLKGCPQSVGGDFEFNSNKVSSFDGIGYIGGDLKCRNNPIQSIWMLFKDESKIELFNEFDIIRDNLVVIDRLNMFLEEIGEPPVERINKFCYNRRYKSI